MKQKALILMTIFSLCLMLTPVSAQNNYTILDDYEVSYNGIVYDLSTEDGNYRLASDNPTMTSEEYVEIINAVIDANYHPILLRSVVVPPIGEGGYAYFVSMGWFYRNSDGWNLKVIPTDSTKSSYPAALSGWNEVVGAQSSNVHWSNQDSLRGQYLCHFFFAPAIQPDWNIAPSIPNKSAFQWIADRCN